MATARQFLPKNIPTSDRPASPGGEIAFLDGFRRRRARESFDWSDLDRETRHLATRFEPEHGILWAYQKHPERPCFAPALLDDVLRLQTTLQEAGLATDEHALPLRYIVWASGKPDVWNLGGDLRLFVELIRARDVAGLHRYAKACVDVCYLNAISLDLPLVTIALVQGDALGGGFEAVLSNDLIIAEEGAQFGLPEVLFNLFPGMGAYSFLARRLDGTRARHMILSGRLWSAEEMCALGVVDQVVPAGQGETALRAYIDRHDQRHAVLCALARVDRRCQPVSYDELIDVTDVWVETALGLGEAELRRMEHLARAQERRARRVAPPAGEGGVRAAVG